MKLKYCIGKEPFIQFVSKKKVVVRFSYSLKFKYEKKNLIFFRIFIAQLTFYMKATNISIQHIIFNSDFICPNYSIFFYFKPMNVVFF